MFLPQTKQNKKAQEMFGDDEYVYDLIMVMASRVCAYIQIHQIEYIIEVHFSVYQLYLNTVF